MGISLAWLLTLGMAALGLMACILPARTSRLYGAPQFDARGLAWVRAAGFRDLGLSLALAILLGAGAPRAAAAIAFATALVAVCDFASIAALRGRTVWFSLTVHASGIAMGLASAALLGAA